MHVFVIILFLVVPTLANVRPPGEPFFSLTRVFVQDTIANAVLLCFFYYHYYILIPKVYFKRKYFEYALYVILFLSLTLTIPHLVGTYIPDYERSFPDFAIRHRPPSLVTMVFDEFRRHLYLFFSAVFFSFLLRTQEHLSDTKEEKVRAELLLLKSQINPHFLFNTLNSIFVLSIKNDHRTSDAIIDLSGLMRYVIKEAASDKIPLARELDYIRNYIGLQRARLGDTARIIFQCRDDGDLTEKQITPLLLITYIENAFKYGVNPDETDCLITTKILVEGSMLTMSVFNKKVPRTTHVDSTGIGIANTTERLRLLYPGKHKLEIEEDGKTYSVNLSLQLI